MNIDQENQMIKQLSEINQTLQELTKKLEKAENFVNKESVMTKNVYM